MSEEFESEHDLEKEGDFAADYIEKLLDIAQLEGDIDIEVRNNRVYISVNHEDQEHFCLLSDPKTVSSLQELTRLAVHKKTGRSSYLILDIGGSREKRKQELSELVDTAVQTIQRGALEAALPPMSSYERKIVHDLVAEKGYFSISRGEKRERYTVVKENK